MVRSCADVVLVCDGGKRTYYFVAYVQVFPDKSSPHLKRIALVFYFGRTALLNFWCPTDVSILKMCRYGLEFCLCHGSGSRQMSNGMACKKRCEGAVPVPNSM